MGQHMKKVLQCLAFPQADVQEPLHESHRDIRAMLFALRCVSPQSLSTILLSCGALARDVHITLLCLGKQDDMTAETFMPLWVFR